MDNVLLDVLEQIAESSGKIWVSGYDTKRAYIKFYFSHGHEQEVCELTFHDSQSLKLIDSNACYEIYSLVDPQSIKQVECDIHILFCEQSYKRLWNSIEFAIISLVGLIVAPYFISLHICKLIKHKVKLYLELRTGNSGEI